MQSNLFIRCQYIKFKLGGQLKIYTGYELTLNYDQVNLIMTLCKCPETVLK